MGAGAAADDLDAVRPAAEALIRAGAEAVLLLELAAESGKLALRVAFRAPPTWDPGSLELDALASGVSGPGCRWVRVARQVAGADPGSESALVCPLDVRPALGPFDTLLVVVAPEDGALEAVALELRPELEARLSERRRATLAAVVLAAVEQADDAVEITDRAARIVYVNRAWQRIFGYERSETLGKFLSELVRDRARPAHDASFYRFTEARVTAGKSWLGVLTSSTRSGGVHLNEANVTPFDAEGETFHGNFVVRRDVAHRAERDAALLAAHREFRGVLSAVPDGVAVLRDGLVYFANPALLRLVDRDEQGVVGLPFADLVAEADREAFSRREPHVPISVRMLSPGGAARLAELSPGGSISFEGRPATILVARDITERRIAEEQLARAERLAALGELAAGVAHELNNPMAYVVMNLELLRSALDERADGSTREPLVEALDGIRRMQEIALELRAFAGSDDAGVAEPVAVDGAVESAINITRNQIRHRATVEREIEPGLAVYAREGQLVQVLVNVLANAADAIPHDGGEHTVRVRVRAVEGGRVEIAISDTGAGIPLEILPRLFDPFATTKARGQGSGLGLAISRRIIDRFGGEIRAENLPSRGARITLTLPAAPAAAKASTAVLRPGSARRERVRVLVIDDETAICRALNRVLKGHDVTTVSDPVKGLELLGQEDFDVVICDLMMPGMSGYKLYASACAARPELRDRFVFVSGGALSEEAGRFLKTCQCPVLPKPFANADVLDAVDRVARTPAGAVARAAP
jgi:PAS domain S-box-containing protein